MKRRVMVQVDQVEEVVSEPVSLDEPLAENIAPSAPSAVPTHIRFGFVGMVLGGVLAAGMGYGLAQIFALPVPVADTTVLEARLTAQDAAIAALNAEIAAAAVSSLQPRLASVETAIAALPDIKPLEARIAALESTLPNGSGASGAAVAALRAEVERLKAADSGDVVALTAEAEARMKEAETRATELKAEAVALAQNARIGAGLGRVQAALDSGAPYKAALADLGADVPAVLQDAAETGLPTLAALQGGFPDAARQALEAALRANMGESWADRVTSFLRSQTGARSLTPREGDDPDAILSRAEAALATGDIPAALAGVATLPQVAQDAMAAWRTKAEQRLAAVAALATIAQSLGE